MKKEKIKPLSIVKEFADYFIRKAKKIRKLKNVDFKSISIDYSNSTEKIHVWFHGEDGVGIIADVYFTLDGELWL